MLRNVLWSSAPPFIVNAPPATYTPPPRRLAALSEISPPVIVNVPPSTYTPPPVEPSFVTAFPAIAPPWRRNTALIPTDTPAPQSSLPPVTAPVPSTPLVSARSPPGRISMTRNLPSASIVWPFRSSVTAFVTTSVASMSVAVTSLASVTVPPASSCICNASHCVITVAAVTVMPSADAAKL